ncbi:MAG: O-methyltransferase family 3 [Frankiales bacterium]|nr:O-methyltransferase family 3 [Frankiales bacterium]
MTDAASRRVPGRAADAAAHALATGFPMSSEQAVGELLRVVAAAVPAGGRILEIGTGTGFGTAWLVDGLGARTDVEVVTVDNDRDRVSAVEARGWPSCVQFVVGDGLEILARSGTFDLVFADAPPGKVTGLDRTIAALRPRGVLVVDDMTSDIPQDFAILRAAVRSTLLTHPELVAVELAHGSGVIVATRRA